MTEPDSTRVIIWKKKSGLLIVGHPLFQDEGQPTISPSLTITDPALARQAAKRVRRGRQDQSSQGPTVSQGSLFECEPSEERTGPDHGGEQHPT